MTTWPGPIEAITLFAEDLEAMKGFYLKVFQLPVHFEDPNSVVFKFGETLVNILRATEAPALIRPAAVASPQSGSRFQLTLAADDVDELCARLAAIGVALLNGPMDRPWGVRTASFHDPAGHIWEIAH